MMNIGISLEQSDQMAEARLGEDVVLCNAY